METLEKMFGSSTHLRVLLLFYHNNGYFNNITGLADTLNKSHITIRKAVADLIEAGILCELVIGKSRVIRINENSPYTKALFDFIDSLRSIKEERSIGEIISARSGKRTKV